jgi:replicative DNA helicase
MDKNFDYLGNTFQIQLLNQIMVDKDFSSSIMDVIESVYFDNKYFKIILQMAKEYYKKYETTPNFDTLGQIVRSEISQEMVAKIVLDTIKQIQDAPIEGTMFVQEKALKFCKQQELQKAMDKAQKIITQGDFESYDKVEGLMRDALQVGEIDKGQTDIFENLDTVLDEDYRHPIPMGIPGIDKLLKGGLAKGEIGVILAPTGVGKTTILSKIANTGFNLGYNVLQIFFEDNPKIIQRKHFTMWTGIEP